MSDEKIIEKIRKILELANNNPSEEEAMAASLKAQKMMAEYHLTMKDIDMTDKSEIGKGKYIHLGAGKQWKFELARVIAKNFRCRHFYYGKKWMTFYGYKEDVKIATMTFQTLFDMGNKLADKYYVKERYAYAKQYREFNGKDVKASYLQGYLQGIEEVLNKQCTALMIVTPAEVENEYKEYSKDFHKLNTKIRKITINEKARESGVFDGRKTMGGRMIAKG